MPKRDSGGGCELKLVEADRDVACGLELAEEAASTGRLFLFGMPWWNKSPGSRVAD
jgi:hypothetical protein